MTSKCAKCNSFSFEIVEQSPRNSKYKFFFVQCSVCGSPIGVLEYFNSGAKIEIVENKIQSLERKIDNLEFILRQKLR